jgi:hypothetical protein
LVHFRECVVHRVADSIWCREGEAQSFGNVMNSWKRRPMKLRVYPQKYPQAVAAGARTP